MMCQRCKKKRASVHITDVSSKQADEMHLCEECAQQEGVSLKSQVSLADFLAGIIKAPATKEMARLAKMACPTCGMTYLDFQSKGRLGCPADYEVFAELIGPLLEKIHGSTRHAGKTPRAAGRLSETSVQLTSLKRKLASAVAEEHYEEAAALRDRIREVEGEESGS